MYRFKNTSDPFQILPPIDPFQIWPSIDPFQIWSPMDPLILSNFEFALILLLNLMQTE